MEQAVLDTYGRKFVQPGLDWLSGHLLRSGVNPQQLTLAALICGLGAAVAFSVDLPGVFVLLLWLSGLLDAVDGSVARMAGQASKAGAFLDIVCDRVVEVTILFVCGWKHPQACLALLAASAAIICSLTVFLTSAATVPNVSAKSFHYQAGLAERTEGFVFLSLFALLPGQVAALAWVFAGVVMLTAVQRFYWTFRLLRD